MTTLEARSTRRLEDVARFPLLFGPSPIQKLDRLTKHLGGQPAIKGYASLFS